MQDMEKIDSDMGMLKKLFESTYEEILKTHTRKQLDEIYFSVYGFYPPSYVRTKKDVVDGLHNCYRSLTRADAFKMLGVRRWS